MKADIPGPFLFSGGLQEQGDRGSTRGVGGFPGKKKNSVIRGDVFSYYVLGI